MNVDPFDWLKGHFENREDPSIGYWQWHASFWKMMAMVAVLVICFGWSFSIGRSVSTQEIEKIVREDVKTEVSEQMKEIRQQLSAISARMEADAKAQEVFDKKLDRIMMQPKYAPKD